MSLNRARISKVNYDLKQVFLMLEEKEQIHF